MRVLAFSSQGKIGSIEQRRFAEAGTQTPSEQGAALDRNGLSVSTETACRFQPKSPVGNSEIMRDAWLPRSPSFVGFRSPSPALAIGFQLSKCFRRAFFVCHFSLSAIRKNLWGAVPISIGACDWSEPTAEGRLDAGVAGSLDGFHASRANTGFVQTLSTSTRKGCSSILAIDKTSYCFCSAISKV